MDDNTPLTHSDRIFFGIMIAFFLAGCVACFWFGGMFIQAESYYHSHPDRHSDP
jgi:hypothetical protein